MPSAKSKSSGSRQASSGHGKSSNKKSRNEARKAGGHSPGKKAAVKKKSRYIGIIKWVFIILPVLVCIYLFYLDRVITERFEGRIWQLPAHVYSRPLELFVGKAISVEQLAFELEYLKYQKVDQLPQHVAQYRRWNDTFEIKTRAFDFWDGKEPSHVVRVVINNNKVSELTDIYSNHSAGLVRFDAGYLTGIFPAHAQDRVLVKINDVPDMFIKMLLLIEDRRFFSHWGVDPRSIARAVVVNLYSGRTVQGGSTITQQLVKNLFLSQDRTLVRKINEAFMSLLLELHYDKRLILETYINEIYLGQDGRRAIHGFGLASKYYFGKPLKELSLDEMAILVAMVKGASFYNPQRNPDNALERRNIVLGVMRDENLVTEAQYRKLADKPVVTVRHASSGRYPAFIDTVKLQLKQDYQAEDLRSEGLRVFTTLDPYIQYKAEQAVKMVLPTLSKSPELQTSAVVVAPLNGDILAVVGDRNPTFRGLDRALYARRQIGSLIKPVVYLTALEQGQGYTLATMLDDSELVYEQPNQEKWQPQNYDKEFHGEVTLYKALLNSYNIPAIRTGMDVGFDEVVKTLSALGYSGQVAAYPSLALGAVEMSPMEVVSIYQTLAANGFHHPLRSVFAVMDKDGKPLQRYALDVDNEVHPESVALINSALIDVTKYGTAKALANNMAIQVAGKTGTSDDLRDSWFAGFSGDIVAVVWTGFDDNRPSYLTGSSGAMKVWQKLMQDTAYKSYQIPEMPSLQQYWVDTKDGLLGKDGCENAVELYFIKGTQPKQNSGNCATGGNWFKNLFK